MSRRGHGEGSIYRRKDGRWAASMTIEGYKRKTFYGKTRKEVQDKLNMALHEQKQGTLVTGAQQTLKQYLESWLEEVHKPSIRISTYVKYRSMLNKHILPTLGHIRLQKLTAQQVQKLYSDKQKEGLSAKSITLIHSLLHSALDNAVRWNLVARNVCDAVSLPRVARHEVQPLTPEQARCLLEAVGGHRLEGILTLALATGMRRGELLALRWQDINFEDRSLRIRRTVDRITGYGYIENEPKTPTSRRNIMLPNFVIDVLKQHRSQQLEARAKAGATWEDNDLVFCNTHGGYLSPDYLLEVFDKLIEEAGLPHIRFHDLRHSAATILLSMGIHPKVVQELLGHSKIGITMDTYSHVLPSMHREAMNEMDDLLGKDS